ncbi:MAG: hypothetical protein JWO94_3035, partial [Verrucomicrobiaceae bacterium]|nr:hypothetical protein [Verrucomicrobiaceae bacterium]
DDIEGDGIFTGVNAVTPAAIGYLGFRVRVQKPGQADYYSEIKQLWAPPVLTDAQVNKAGALADSATTAYQNAVTGGSTPQEAAEIVADLLRQDPDIGAVGTTEEGGVWWVTNEGVLGVCHQFLADQKAGGGAASPVAQRGPAPPVLTAEQSKNPPQNPYYNTADLSTLFPSTPAGQTGAPLESLSHLLSTAGMPSNRIKSDRAVMISPFIANPFDLTNSFGTKDDWYKPWPTISAHKTCGLYADKELLNNGSVGIALGDFKNLSRYGYIHISTHGDNYYNGLLSDWKNAWGPNDFLKGNLSIVGIYSGLKLSVVGGKYVKTGYEDDIAQKRIAIGGGGSIVLLPKFFNDYLTALPNSLVVLSACRSGYNGSLMSAFLSKGAGAVIGYTDYVSTSYAQKTLQEVVDRMYEDKTLGEALSSAVTIYGSNDAAHNPADKDPAYLVYLGADDLKFPDSQLSNGGFEDGVLDPWERNGDGRVITALGVTRPTKGTFMGIISTGLGFTTTSGSIQQRLCVPSAGGLFAFDWDFFSEEWLEYVGSEFQDAFSVSVAEVDATSGAVGAFTTLFYQDIDSLQDFVYPADVGFDQGDVYATGWRTATLDLNAYKGKTIMVRFGCTDVGDSIYDSAILLDEISVLPVPVVTH